MSLVSVLMPAYNHERFVREAVESVLGQSHSELDLIIIDDASSDGTWDVLQGIGDGRLTLHRHEANRGAHTTLNEALSMARGDHVAILNSDDVYEPHRIEWLLATAETWGETGGLAFTNVSFVNEDGHLIPEHSRVADYTALCDSCASLPPMAWFLAGNPAISTSNFFFSRKLAEQVGGFSPLRYTHDWDWLLRAQLEGQIVWVREELLRYRVHSANTLSEDDRWRHIHENSYVQAAALLALRQRSATARTTDLAPELMRALLRNDSLHPVALLHYLACGLGGVTEERLIEETQGTEGNWPLAALAQASGLPAMVFEPLKVSVEREKAVRTQAAMLDERWNVIQHMNAEIASRNKWLADQRAVLEEKDRCIAGQAAMIEERWRAMQEMGREIAERQERLDQSRQELAQTRQELATLCNDRLVRAALRLRYVLDALRQRFAKKGRGD